MCHGFLAHKDSGERLSHAVGCAFAVCLERKQRRDTECGVTMTFDTKTSTFTRSGSFRTHTITERLNSTERGVDIGGGTPTTPSAIVTPQPKPHNPFAIERPHVTPLMLERLERQGSFRAVSTQSPFKRQMSLRINDLPSNAERQKAYLDPLINGGGGPAPRTVSPIPEISPQKQDTVAQLCQELSQGLSLLTRTDESDDLNLNNIMSINQNTVSSVAIGGADIAASGFITNNTKQMSSPTGAYTSSTMYSQTNANTVMSVFPIPVVAQTQITPTAQVLPYRTDYNKISTSPTATSPQNDAKSSANGTITHQQQLPNAEQWLGQVVQNTSPSPKRAPMLTTHTRAKSLSSGASDPFDAEWVAGVTKPEMHNTNPFISPPKPPAQSFQVQL